MSDTGVDAFSVLPLPLHREENELLTRVTGDAPMGRFLRENYWFPATLSQNLEADGSPERVRLLGERFVAFRATDGRVGFFAEACPHRRVSLALARNESNGLRCIFHGWKFSVDGVVEEAPTQRSDRDGFCKRVPLKHYPVCEAAGLVWVFLGRGPPPPLPGFEFMALSGDQISVAAQTLRYNWVQNLDGLADSAHIGVMHREFMMGFPGNDYVVATIGDTAPLYEFQDRPGGFRFAAIRQTASGQRYARASEFVAPWYVFLAFPHGYVNISVPVDDETTRQFIVQYRAFGALRVEAKALDDLSSWPPYPEGSPEENWGQDRQAMARGSFSGFGIHEADFVVAESQGAISEREEEFLCDSDLALDKLRRLLMAAAMTFAEGKTPKIADHATIPYREIVVGDWLLSEGEDWRSKTT